MIDISSNCKGFNAGYVFKLEEKSIFEGCIHIDDDTSVKFSPNSCYVYLNLKDSLNKPSKDLRHSFEKVEKALDYLSCCGYQNSIIILPLNHFIKWQSHDHGYRLVINESSISSNTISFSENSDHKLTNYNKGFRFFRYSQISRDLLDSYRNLWLSFECLISTYTPKKNNETEYDWYCRGLDELSIISSDYDLKKLLEEIPVKTLIRDLYTNTRCSLFHSKQNKSFFIPHQLDYYETVKCSLSKLTIIVLAMFEQHHSIQIKSSWINPYIFVDSYRELFEGLSLHVTDCDNEKSLNANEIKNISENEISNPVLHKIIKKSAIIKHRFEGKVFSKNTKLTKIRRFSFVKENKELIAFTIDEQLNLKDVHSIKVVSDWDIGYIEKPKSYDYRINLDK